MKKVKKITLWAVAIVFLCLAILQICNLFTIGLLTPDNLLVVVLKIFQVIFCISTAALAFLDIKVKSGRFSKIYPKLLFVTLFFSGISLVISGLSFFGGNSHFSQLGIPKALISIVFGSFYLVLGIYTTLSKTLKEENNNIEGSC